MGVVGEGGVGERGWEYLKENCTTQNNKDKEEKRSKVEVNAILTKTSAGIRPLTPPTRQLLSDPIPKQIKMALRYCNTSDLNTPSD